MVLMVNVLCTYYSIGHGSISFGCDGLGPLHRCFDLWYTPSPSTPHYDLIKAIQFALAQSPITWSWQHIRGHQDETIEISALDQWACLNIEMDSQAKAWLNHLETLAFKPSSCSLPGKGWSCWAHEKKFPSFPMKNSI